MRQQPTNHWDPLFFEQSSLFWPILPAYPDNIKNQSSWPTLQDYNLMLAKEINNKNNKPISFVTQNDKCPVFEEEYEPKIYLSGQIQTRLNNWHDFFQVLVWKTFPKTKALLNKFHFDAATIRQQTTKNQRTAIENFVTLFDECGSIVVATDKAILDLVSDFKWQEFFVNNKQNFGKNIECLVFGHAMYEKALSPYIGMTSHCLLFIVEGEYFNLATAEKTEFIDKLVHNYLSQQNNLTTKTLTPLPILGVPGWYNYQDESFYNNTQYFRTGRKKK